MQEQDRTAVFLSYLGFLFLLPPYIAYFFMARSKYARFHARQGVYLTFCFIAGLVLFGLCKLVLSHLGWNVRFLYVLYGLWFFLYVLLNMLAAIYGLMGRLWHIPVLGKWAEEAPAS